METFTKHDKQKTQYSLIDPSFVTGVAEILTLGAEKYGKGNWQKCKEKARYDDALMRHLMSYFSGEKNDQESGKSHLLHAACNLMILNYLEEK
mgnify:CR=1 FL=1